MVWRDSRSQLEDDIWGASVRSTGGANGPDALVGVSAPSQQDPRIVWNGGGYTFAWVSQTSTTSRVLVQRLDAAGAPIDAQAIEVAAGRDLVEPWIAWSGTRDLVTWKARSNVRVYSRRLAPDHSFQDPAPIDVMTGDGPAVGRPLDRGRGLPGERPPHHEPRRRVAARGGERLLPPRAGRPERLGARHV
ncbi:MAG: hypothetical protein MUC67_08755 [Acidobacteria bacterium]|nr:hypothetical protein [Acidobacteriota bacterium]